MPVNTDNTMRGIYDEFADTYDENRGQFDMSAILEGFYKCLGNEKANLLDLGCGAGEPFARFFVDHGWEVTGVDFSERMLQLASKYVPGMTLIHADMRDVDFAANQFSAITAIYSLFHVPSTDHILLFEKFYRWLVPGGKLLFTYATVEYTGKAEYDGYIQFMGKQLYYSHLSPDDLYRNLGEAGFSIKARDYHEIGGETFLWVTVVKPVREA